MTKVMCLVALSGLFIFCKVIPSLCNEKGDENVKHHARNEFLRSNSDGQVTLDEQEDYTIEEEIEKLGDLHGYFKNEAHHSETTKTPKQPVQIAHF